MSLDFSLWLKAETGNEPDTSISYSAILMVKVKTSHQIAAHIDKLTPVHHTRQSHSVPGNSRALWAMTHKKVNRCLGHLRHGHLHRNTSAGYQASTKMSLGQNLRSHGLTPIPACQNATDVQVMEGKEVLPPYQSRPY